MMKLPQNVEIIEVCPRDGFQNIAAYIPAQTKLAVIDALAGASNGSK